MKRTMFSLAILLGSTCIAGAQPLLPNFDPAGFDADAVIDNPYMPLLPGYARQISGQITDEDSGATVIEISHQSHEGAGPMIAGVQTVMIRDRSTIDGRLVEETLDYFAQDKAGNVWYLGEDVINLAYDASGKVSGTDTHGTWRAGVNGALPGFAMPAGTALGMTYFQEHAPVDEAMDLGEIAAVDQMIVGPTGSYDQVLAVFETSQVEPSLRGVKFYAQGVGLVRVWEGVDAQRANPEAVFDLTAKE